MLESPNILLAHREVLENGSMLSLLFRLAENIDSISSGASRKAFTLSQSSLIVCCPTDDES